MNENENSCVDDIIGYNTEGTPICSNKTCLHNMFGLCIPDEHIGD